MLGAQRDDFGERVLSYLDKEPGVNVLSALAWWEPDANRTWKRSFSPAAGRLPISRLAGGIVNGMRSVALLEFEEEGGIRGRTGDAGVSLYEVVSLLELRRTASPSKASLRGAASRWIT